MAGGTSSGAGLVLLKEGVYQLMVKDGQLLRLAHAADLLEVVKDLCLDGLGEETYGLKVGAHEGGIWVASPEL